MTDEGIRDHAAARSSRPRSPFTGMAASSHDEDGLPVRFDDFERSFLIREIYPRLSVVSPDSSQHLKSDPPLAEVNIGLDDSLLCQE